MMRALLVVVVLLAPLWASAQETYSFPAAAAQVDRVDIGRVTHNEQKCAEAGLALDCTQAELRAVPGFDSGRIYGDSEAERTAFIRDTVIVPWFQQILGSQKAWDTEKAQQLWSEADRTTRDQVCTTLGLPAGCELF